MATDTYLPEAKNGRPPLRRTPRGTTYSQGRPRAGGRTQQGGGTEPSRTGGRTSQGTSGSRRVSTAAPKAAPSRQPSRPSSRTARINSGVRSARQFTAPEFREYQGIVLAEFIAAELLVAATPIATRQNTPGLSPYIPRDMTKMLAIGLLYFILELLAVGGGKMARLSAWFGGLILLTVGLNEGANIAKDLDIFGAQPKATTSTPPDQAV